MFSQPPISAVLLIRRVVLLSVAAVPMLATAQQRYSFKADLDPFVTVPDVFAITPDKIDEMFIEEGMKKNPYFQWMTKDRRRAHFTRRPFSNVTIDMTIFGGEVPIEEATVDFRDGKLHGVTISIFNRGDGGDISGDDFDKRFKLCGQKIGETLEIRPFRRKANPTQGALTEGWIWISQKGMAVLEHNPEATGGSVEFLRMRLARRDATGAYAAAMDKRAGASVKLSELPKNVQKDGEGNVFVEGVPMVDQGQKGYCVVASAQRLFEYYGIPCDQHQLAQIAGSDPQRGTSSVSIKEELGKIDHRFKTRFDALAMLFTNGRLHEITRRDTMGSEVDERDFLKKIHKYIDDGIPLLWGLEVGRYPEEPDISQQAGGGHMRMIIGYNDRSGHVIFTDSWGAGHEFKKMKAGDAFKATHGLFLLQPITR